MSNSTYVDYAKYFDNSGSSKDSGSNLFSNIGSAATYNSDSVQKANQDSLNYTGAAGQQAIAQAGQSGQQQLALAKDASSFGANQSALGTQQNVQNQINLANSQAARTASANLPGTKSYTWGTTMSTNTSPSPSGSASGAGAIAQQPNLSTQFAVSDHDRYNQQLVASQSQQAQQQLAQTQVAGQTTQAQIQANAQLQAAKTQADAQVQSSLFGALGGILGGSGGGGHHQYW